MFDTSSWLTVGANRTNLADGAQLLDIPGEAHEHAGHVEVHNRYFEDLLLRLL